MVLCCGKGDAMNARVLEAMDVSDLMTIWLEDVRGKVQATSFVSYQNQVQIYILPLLGNVMLKDVSSETAEYLRNELQKRELSPYLVKDVSSRFSQALRWGAAQGYDLPVLKNSAVKREKVVRTLTAGEQKELELSLLGEKDAFVNVVLLTWKAGLTTGEACGLKWSDIDKVKKALTVRRICQRMPAGVEYSTTEERTVALPEGLRGAEDLGWVIRSAWEAGAEPRLCQIWLRDHIKKTGLPKDITYAALRNTYIRDLVESGTDFIKISRLTGNRDLNDLWRKFGEYYKERV